MPYDKITVPSVGEKIVIENGKLNVPNNPVIPFIEGDGMGVDIWAASVRVLDAAVQKAYNTTRKINWMEVYAGEKADYLYGPGGLPDETIEALKEYKVAIKGPMTIPSGKKRFSISAALRQALDLYTCLRSVRYYTGLPSPMKYPEKVDMTIFREHAEDIYAGVEFENGTEGALKLRELLESQGLLEKVRFPETSSFGIKPISKEGTQRIVRGAIEYAIAQNKTSVTLVHKGDHMEFLESDFVKWGYEFAKEEFGNETIAAEDCGGNAPDGKILITDCSMELFLQKILVRPQEYSVVVTTNLNGDYISDTLMAVIGGVGIIPRVSVNYESGVALFETTHGSAPKYAGLDKVNPSSVILSGMMMFRHLGWSEAAALIEKAIEKVISSKTVTFDLARLIDGAIEVKCSEFGDALVEQM